MIFKRNWKKNPDVTLLKRIQAFWKYFREHETPAIAGVAIAKLSKAGKETIG